MALNPDLVIRLQCAAFVDAQSLKQDQEFVPALLERLQGRELQALPLVEGPLELVMGLLALDGVHQLIIQTNRFDYNVAGPLPAADAPDWRAFADDSVEVLAAALDVSRRLSRRIALNVRVLATDRVARAASPDAVGRRLLSLPDSFHERPLEGWVWKAPYKAELGAELCNLIPQISRATSTIAGQETDGIEVLMDVNTVNEHARLRFGPDNLPEVVNSLLEGAQRLLEEVESAIGEF